MAEITRNANAVWRGDLRQGKGRISTGSTALTDQPYSFAMRFEDSPGTNPEELIAAAHAACYSMAFANTLATKGYKPESIQTHATCTLARKQGGGFGITKMRLQVRGQVPGISAETFAQVAEEADKSCPVSNLLRPGLEIERETELL
jgi:osmotically inducible protein OsmC